MYVVEVVQTNKIVKCKIRTEDYDKAADVFARCKTSPCRELRLFRTAFGDRVLLKYLIKVRSPTTASAPAEVSNDELPVSDTDGADV